MKKYYPAPEGRDLLSSDNGSSPSDLRCGTSLTHAEQDRSNLYVRSLRRRARFAACILRSAPFLRCVILTGSIARGDAKYGSDIDLLIIGKSGRLFTMRFFTTILMIFLGIKRSSNPEKEYAGRICLNYYLADDYLQIPTGRGTKIDRYCAENYAKAKFLSGDYSLFSRFLQRNIKLFHKYGVKLGVPYNEFSGGTQYAAPIITKMWEKILSGKFGDRVESKLKSSQISRIEANPIARNQSDLIAYNDKEIRFHPSKTVQN